MASLSSRFVRNDHLLASDIIDDEAIIIRLGDGTYYSLRGSGAAIWAHLTSSPSLDDLVDAVVASFDVEPEQARQDLEALLTRLVAEELVRAESTSPAGPSRQCQLDSSRQLYTPPRIECHRDMAELLALDPPTPNVLDHLLRRPAELDAKPSEGSRRA